MRSISKGVSIKALPDANPAYKVGLANHVGDRRVVRIVHFNFAVGNHSVDILPNGCIRARERRLLLDVRCD